MYIATTRDITVSVVPHYLEEQSSPDINQYLWAYQVEITNNGTETIQLRSRYWKISDANGNVEEVRGPGVIGEQPILGPGEHFIYTSGCPLNTSSGFMQGHYTMTTMDGEEFEIDIPAFSLDLPDEQHSVH